MGCRSFDLQQPFLFGSNAFAVESVGVDEGSDDHGQQHGEDGPEGEAARHHDHQTADHPKSSGEAVGAVPVFFAVQRPGNLDADGVVLLAFGQIVADDDKQQTHKQGHHHIHGHIAAQRGNIGNGKEHQLQHRDDPQHQMQDFGRVVIFLGIGTGSQYAQPLESQHDKGHTKDTEGLACPTIYLTGCVPVHGDLLRQLVP